MPKTTLPPAVTLPPDEARAWLVSHLGLATPPYPQGAEGVRALLRHLRHIQLDPLDVIGTNADLVALARVDGIAKGDVYRHLYPGHAFEHWAKERCLLPASAFPHYRERSLETPWWRLATRLERLPEKVLGAVLEEVEARGPLTAAELTDHGAVKPLDWSGWKGTGKATSMALEVLWTRCEIVVCGRGPGGKRYDVPHRALPEAGARPRRPHPGRGLRALGPHRARGGRGPALPRERPALVHPVPGAHLAPAGRHGARGPAGGGGAARLAPALPGSRGLPLAARDGAGRADADLRPAGSRSCGTARW